MSTGSNKCAYWNCDKRVTGSGRYCSRRCSQNALVSIRRKELKMLAVEYLGGKCVRCGYSGCVDVFDFHHTDPTQKEFSISKYGHTYSFDRVKVELDKCELLCSNCHREHHFEHDNGKTILSEVLKKRKRAETLQGRSTSKCVVCGNMTKNKMFCSRKCYKQDKSKSIPPLKTLYRLYRQYGSVVKVGKHFGVSDNAVRKWFKRYDSLDMIKRKSRPQTT